MRNAVLADGPLGQGVAGDLLAGQAVGEQGGRAGRHAVGEVRGLVEQGQHRVQVPVGGRARRAAGRAEELPLRGQAGGVPDSPEHVLGAAAFLDRVFRGGEQAGQALGRRRNPVRHHGQVAGVEQGAGEHIRGALPLGIGVGEQLEGPAQAAQAEGVGAAEGPAEELARGRLVEFTGAQRAAQQHQQRPGARLLGQRQLVPGHRDRDVGRGQRPAQQRHLPGGRTDQDGHARPGHAVGQVGAAQRVGDQRGLLGGAVRDQDAGLAGRALRRGHQQPVAGLGGACPWRGREPARHPAGRGQQVAAAAAAGAQRHHRRGLAVRGAEPVRELGERAHVGAAERVDGLVRVADRDQLPAVPGQRHQQRLLGRVAVLVLVHQHHVVGAALALPGLLAAEQGGGDADDLGVVVGRDRRQVEAGRVPVEEPGGGHPVVAVLVLAELAQPAPVQAALGRAEQQVAHLLGEAPGGQGGP